jgi:polar amino acid transport system substrate-binding protein
LLLRLVSLVIVSGTLLTSGCQKKESGTGALRWGADEEGGAPYISKDAATGQYVGFEVDLAAALAKELGRPMEFQQHEFKNLINDLHRGDIDLAMNGLEITPDRQKLVRFSRPYYIYRLQLTARNDAPFTSLMDLQGKKDVKVGTLTNTAAARLLERLNIPATAYDDQVNPYRDLALGRLDAVLLDLPIALYVVKKNDELNSKLKFIGEPIEPGRYAIAFRKDDEALAQQVDQALERLIQNGELKRICEKWGLWNEDQKQLGSEPARPTDPLSTTLKR